MEKPQKRCFYTVTIVASLCWLSLQSILISILTGKGYLHAID